MKEDLRQQARRDIEALIEALSEPRQTVRMAEQSSKQALKALDGDSDVRAALEAIQPAGVRTRANSSLEAVEQARHAVRRSVFALGLGQGLSIGELGRAWGFSRQLAARYAKEARESD